MECLEENTEKYKTFSVPIEKEVKNIDKDGNETVVTISYKIKPIDSTKFMVSSLPNLVDNVAEGVHKIKSKDCDCFLEYEGVKGNLIKLNVYIAMKISQTRIMKNYKIDSRTHLSFLIMISINVLCY